jgi:hypothetical protein
VVLDYALSDNVFARARVSAAPSVHLWLGAGVMLEYELGEAKQLLVSGEPVYFFIFFLNNDIYI